MRTDMPNHEPQLSIDANNALTRREFVTGFAALSGTFVAATGHAMVPQGAVPMTTTPEFYELRRYAMTNGPQTGLVERFFGDALIPALNRLSVAPVGAFALTIGPETPSFYLLLPSASLEGLVTADLRLAKDEAFLKAAAPFWNAPATAPAFVRMESSLLRGFEGWPRLVLPAATATHGKRIFQLRTYEQPSHQDHVRKIAMFHDGEFDLFARAGFGQVFYGDTLIGPRLPNLTYMLSFADMHDLEHKWESFVNDPEWKKLSTSPRYAYEEIVSNITNLILRPLACSQI